MFHSSSNSALQQNSPNPYTANNPYAQGADATPGDTRATEAWAMVTLAQRLEGVRSQESPSDRDIREVVRLNWRAWSLLQEGFLSPETELPADVRGNLLSLSRFIDQHSSQLLRAPNLAGLEILISINRNLAEGLLMNAPESAQGAVSPMQHAQDTQDSDTNHLPPGQAARIAQDI